MRRLSPARLRPQADAAARSWSSTAATNPVEDSNLQPVGWCLDAWSLGTDGVLPWQTVGNGDSWRRADELSLFYPRPARDPAAEGPGVIPSVRLKAYRRGQQDVEYLTLWSLRTGEPRWAVGRQVREALSLAGARQATRDRRARTPAGSTTPRSARSDLWALRVRVGEALSAAHPRPDAGSSTSAPRPATRTRVVSGE